MAARTLLDSLELPQAQCVDVEDEQALAQHAVPALEGDWLQRQARRAARVSLTGVLTGDEAREALGELRDRFRLAQPVDFVADITTATRIGKVLVEALEVREVAGRPARFEYAFGLREWLDPPRPETEIPPVRPRPIEPKDQGQLDVEVTVEGQPDFEMSRVAVTATGRGADGNVSTRALTERNANVWSARELDPGEYTATATAAADGLTGSATGTVEAGKTTRVQIVLRPRQAVALAFIVHFRFDSSFVEPCMRAVLRRAVDFGASPGHTTDKLLTVGHTDRVGSDEYNQSLSERRARAVFAFLTFGRDPDGAVREWTAIRQTRPPGTIRTLADSWGVREYQWMLQDLGWYPGTIDGDKGTGNSLTNQAIRAFRCHKGLPPGTHVDDEFWEALIRDYLGQDNFSWPADRLLPNCPGEPLKWLGCGEEDPVNNTPNAHRPNRRVELLFVTDPALPCQPPEPDTFRLPPASPAGTAWCVGPAPARSGHACFLARGTAQPPRWLFGLAEDDSVDATGRVSREVRQPDGSVTLERVPNRPVVTITAAGEFQRSEQGRGDPTPDVTRGGSGTPDPRGTYGPYAGKPEGIWTVEVLPQPRSQPVLLRLEDDEDGPVRGGLVCKRLHTGDTTLNVVIVAAPAVREIRLPAVAHVMTALHPTTRDVRTCTGFGGRLERQASSLTDDQVRAAFAAANRVWRQGRIRFDLVDIVREAYAFRTDCEVDASEFAFLLERCAYPRAVNVFFVGDLAGNGEAGFGISPEGAVASGLAAEVSGCAVGDRFQTTILGPPISTPVDGPLREQVLAHELGHYLNLPHVTGAAAADPNRLMQPSGSTGANRLIAPDEVTVARNSQGAADDCTPLSLTVTGAARIGGTLSHRFVFVRDPASPATVTVDAVIPDAMLDPARGALVMAGGTAGANPKQQVVPIAATGTVEITATYTPVGGTPVVRRVFVHVVDFTLAVPGQTPETPGGSTFLIHRQAGGSVRVVANLSSTPFCVPSTLVTWDPDDAATRLDDPLQRTISIDPIRDLTLRATVAGVTRQVRITTFDVAITDNNAPFDTTVAQVQIEGILATDLASYDIGDLFNTQAGSVFRIRVDLPGATLPLNASLASTDGAGTAIETHVFPLTRLAGDRFVSLPILAIPAAIPRTDITFAAPQSIEVIRARAQGRVRLRVQGRLATVPPVDARVRGRVLEFCTLTIQGASPNPALLLGTANRVMAQDGIEFRILTVLPTLNSPQLLDIARTTCPLTIGGDGLRGAEETALFALGRAACAANFLVYFIRSDSLALRGCSAYPTGSPGVTVCDSATQYTMGHEIGHVLNLPHLDPPAAGSLNNLMNQTTGGLPAVPSQVRLTAPQCALMDGSGFLVFRV